MGLKSSAGRQLPMGVRLSSPLNNGTEQQVVRLEITDLTSRMIVMEIELDPDAFMALMTNRGAEGMAGVTTRLDRVGKTMQHETLTFPPAEFGNQLAADAAGRAWAEEEGWDTVDVHRTNSSHWVLTGRRWIEPEAAS